MTPIRHFLLLSFLIFSSFLFSQTNPNNEEVAIAMHWESCTAKDGEGNFTIKFPEEPLYDQTLQTLKLLHQGIKYELAFEEHRRPVDLHSSKHILQNRSNNFIKKLNKHHKVQVDTSINIKMLGLNAQENQMRYSELGKKRFIIYRVLITKKYIYEFVLRSEDKYVEDSLKTKFVDSFHLLDNQIIKAHWHKHISTRGHFQIDLPAEAIISTSKKYQIITSNVEEISCQLYYFREPETYDKNDIDEVLDKMISNLEKELGKKIDLELESSERLQMLGYPAKEAKFSASTSGISIKIIFRVLATPKELFQFQIVSSYDYVDENTAHRFFDSFELLGE